MSAMRDRISDLEEEKYQRYLNSTPRFVPHSPLTANELATAAEVSKLLCQTGNPGNLWCKDVVSVSRVEGRTIICTADNRCVVSRSE